MITVDGFVSYEGLGQGCNQGQPPPTHSSEILPASVVLSESRHPEAALPNLIKFIHHLSMHAFILYLGNGFW